MPISIKLDSIPEGCGGEVGSEHWVMPNLPLREVEECECNRPAPNDTCGSRQHNTYIIWCINCAKKYGWTW